MRLSKVLFGVFFFFIGFYLVTKTVHSQVPTPYVSCSNTGSPEFHSLRPYQKSPCENKAVSTAKLCGNSLVLTDSVPTIQITPPENASNCKKSIGSSYTCSFTVTQSANYKIDLANATFPIMGNTELVTNYKGEDDQIDDSQKVNEYVSWYLNGVTGRAEYEFTDDQDKIVNYSGPLKKLLPFDVQNEFRIETIKAAGESQHDQIVACTRLGVPVPCYDSRFSNLITNQERLSDWNGKISALPTSLNTWNKRIPPLRKDFDNYPDYLKAYREWRGSSCGLITIPIINKKVMLCFDNPLRPNSWSNLFSYIPLSSTEDAVGEVSVEKNEVSGTGGAVVKVNSFITTPAKLYFSHINEALGLSEKLQLTFVPKDQPTIGEASVIDPNFEKCNLANVRSNEGDSLFADSIEGILSYTATFACDLEEGKADQACSKDLEVLLKVTTETPKADELWSRLVAGPASVFKKIFPKVGEGGAIYSLLDMPSASKVDYSGTNLISNQGSAELYFPHIGGISEYFLKGIQTALRPKGYGEEILSGSLQEVSQNQSGEVNCNKNAAAISTGKTISKDAASQLALNWVSGQLGNHVQDCYNDVLLRAKKGGVNPALALLLWLHESNASNYGISSQDFGVASTYAPGFINQINGFIQRAKDAEHTKAGPYCQGRADVKDDFQAWALVYRSGTACDPTDVNAAEFYNDMVEGWGWVAPDCPLPTSPTDLSCY